MLDWLLGRKHTYAQSEATIGDAQDALRKARSAQERYWETRQDSYDEIRRIEKLAERREPK